MRARCVLLARGYFSVRVCVPGTHVWSMDARLLFLCTFSLHVCLHVVCACLSIILWMHFWMLRFNNVVACYLSPGPALMASLPIWTRLLRRAVVCLDRRPCSHRPVRCTHPALPPLRVMLFFILLQVSFKWLLPPLWSLLRPQLCHLLHPCCKRRRLHQRNRSRCSRHLCRPSPLHPAVHISHCCTLPALCL